MQLRSVRRGVAVLAMVMANASWAWSPGGSALPSGAATTRLEIKLGGIVVPSAQLLDWELSIDGARVAPVGALAGTREWVGSFTPGPHTIGVRVQYSRDLKTLVHQLGGERVGFTFVAGGARWVGRDTAIDVSPSSVVRLEATVDEDPDAIADRLNVAAEQERVHVEGPGAPADRFAGVHAASLPAASRQPAWHGEFDIARHVQERVAWVAALVSPQLVGSAGRSGEARARFSVDERGYVREVQLEVPTGVDVFDGSVADVLRLAEPYPYFEGTLAVTLPYTGLPLLSGSPLVKLPAYRRQ